MKFSVMSRVKAKKYSYQVNHDCIIISITDVFSNQNIFHKNTHIKAVHHVQFDDVEKGEPNCITQKQAENIVSFVNRYKDKVEEIVVHCEAGISRSSGVCAAIMKAITGSDFEVFDNHKYTPNMTCYRMVLNCFFAEIDEKEISEKEQHNIDIWKKANDID